MSLKHLQRWSKVFHSKNINKTRSWVLTGEQELSRRAPRTQEEHGTPKGAAAWARSTGEWTAGAKGLLRGWGMEMRGRGKLGPEHKGLLEPTYSEFTKKTTFTHHHISFKDKMGKKKNSFWINMKVHTMMNTQKYFHVNIYRKINKT